MLQPPLKLRPIEGEASVEQLYGKCCTRGDAVSPIHCPVGALNHLHREFSQIIYNNILDLSSCIY